MHIKCPKTKGCVFPHKTLTVILLFISASNTHQNTKALCKLQMAKQVVFGNTTACAALAMPESLLITNNSQKTAFVYGFLGLSAHKKPICTQFTHLSISRCGGSC